MKYIVLTLVFFYLTLTGYSQGVIPDTFFNGKSVVLVSSDPGSSPAMTWQAVADSVHQGLVDAGGDPIGYFELEKVTLSEVVQTDYAKIFEQRHVKNIVLVTRNSRGTSIHVGSFTGDSNIIPSTTLYGVQANDVSTASSRFASAGQHVESQNLLVLDVPEFLSINPSESSASEKFLARNPLNLDVFKLGIPIEGSSAETGLLSYFRYDLYGKSADAIIAEQASRKAGIEQILAGQYPYEIEWLTEAKTQEQLIKERIQFVLMKVQGREADLQRSMGLQIDEANPSQRIVVKYYIKLLVRDELYIGPEWDAHPDWRIALADFLKNLKKLPQ